MAVIFGIQIVESRKILLEGTSTSIHTVTIMAPYFLNFNNILQVSKYFTKCIHFLTLYGSAAGGNKSSSTRQPAMNKPSPFSAFVLFSSLSFSISDASPFQS